MTAPPRPGLERLDAVLFDIGDTLVRAAAPGTPTAALTVDLRPNVVEDLRALAARGLRLGAVTDTATMTESDVRTLLRPSGLDDLLEVLVTSSDVGVAKPDPRSLRTALDRLAVVPDRVLYVGDRAVDRDAASAAGTHFAFVGDTIGDTVTWWASQAPGAFSLAARALALGGRGADGEAARAARAHLDALAKPPGSLGRLEDLAVRLASIAGTLPPPLPSPAAVVVFAGDHGVHAAGVTAWPQEITTAMAATIANERASINALAAAVGASVTLVDVGMATPVTEGVEILHRRIRAGTRDLSVEAAMTLSETTRALDVGASVANDLIEAGAGCLVVGEMGIANTTPSAALVAAFCGRTAGEVAGRGAGADDETLARKVTAIGSALARHRVDDDPLEVLASLGGLEVAAMAGAIVAAAAARVPVVVDGLIADAALLAADRIAPGAASRAVAGHRSAEQAATIAMDHLGVAPLLDLDMRLGEGTGAVLAVPLLVAAARLLRDVATIDEVTAI